MKKLMLASFLLSFCQMAMAVNWFANPNNPDNAMQIFIDLDSVQKHHFKNKKDFYLTAWIKTVSQNDRVASNGQLYNTVTVFTYFDCKNRKTADEEILGYYRNYTNAVSYEKYNVNKTSSATWRRVAPNTMSEALLHMACDAYEIGSKYGYQF